MLVVSSGEAAGAIDLPEHGDRLPRILDEDDVDLRLLHEAAVLRAVAIFFGGGDGQPAELDAADQRVGDGAAFGDARFDREVGVQRPGHGGCRRRRAGSRRSFLGGGERGGRGEGDGGNELE